MVRALSGVTPATVSPKAPAGASFWQNESTHSQVYVMSLPLSMREGMQAHPVASEPMRSGPNWAMTLAVGMFWNAVPLLPVTAPLPQLDPVRALPTHTQTL